ncbi:unnamed protein product [Cuscuta epithymum]|nr:unnamed protein product [Cuscuta epithymum]
MAPTASLSYTTIALKALLVLSLAATSLTTVLSARSLSVTESAADLRARLRLEEENPGQGSSECWESLFALRACTGEVILFFMNGETYLGQDCCHSIRSIQKHCWSHSLLESLGLTSQESDILRGYCDATAAEDGDGESARPPPTPPSRCLTTQPTVPTPSLPPSTFSFPIDLNF